MSKHLKCSAFNEHRIFISYTSQHWSALIKKCKYRFLTHSSLTRGLNYLQYNPPKINILRGCSAKKKPQKTTAIVDAVTNLKDICFPPSGFKLFEVISEWRWVEASAFWCRITSDRPAQRGSSCSLTNFSAFSVFCEEHSNWLQPVEAQSQWEALV